jgi:ABC-type Zn uptake system ZnuABC Zn-binding protein ZnuA
MTAKVRGTKVVTYHKSWTYMSQWLGLQEVGYLEPKPGIPPDPDHLFRLIQSMRAEHVQVLLAEDFYNLNTARLVAEKGGAKLLDLPTDVGAKPEIKDWFILVETILKQLSSAVGA